MLVSPDQLYRIKDDTWLFQLGKQYDYDVNLTQKDLSVYLENKEENNTLIRLKAPHFHIALIAANILKEKNLQRKNIILKPFAFEVLHYGALDGQWRIKIITDRSTFSKRVWQSIPFTRVIEDNTYIRYQIDRITPEFLKRLYYVFDHTININKPVKQISSKYLCIPSSFVHKSKLSFLEALNITPFEDAFSQIATEAIQRWEKSIYPKFKSTGQYRIVLRNNLLEIERYISSVQSLLEAEENRSTIRSYKKFLIKEYGKELIDYIDFQYSININDLIRKGLPLFPETVYRFNIGVNNIEIQHINSIYNSLIALREDIRQLPEPIPLANYIHATRQTKSSIFLPKREWRALCKLITTTYNLSSNQDILSNYIADFLDNLFNSNFTLPCKELPADIFNTIVSLSEVQNASAEKLYTGKKIIHRAIMGYYLHDDQNSYLPWVDQQELLQTFPSLRKPNDWKNYYELLSHIVAKKHLVRKHPVDKWRVGALIPAPNTENGQKRWYRIDSCLDDGHGDFNYTLVPACLNYCDLPTIKLYRSTASSPYAMSGSKSIDADLQLARAPGAGTRSEADELELPFFINRTIPMWVAYYLKAKDLQNKIPDIEDTEEIQTAITTQIAYDYGRAINLMLEEVHNATITTINLSEISQYNLSQLRQKISLYESILYCEASNRRELPEYKIATDIAFVGHSLGGALAQGGLCHFGIQRNRIPLPGYKYIAYFIDSPAVTNTDVSQFYNFGIQHQNVLHHLKQRWQLIAQFEYGDFIPQAGEMHLSATNLPENMYKSWLEIDNTIFRPLDSANAKAIITAPTHGRRIGLAQEGIDYSITSLTPKDLYEYHSCIWLPQELQKIFGYRFFNSPILTEQMRRIIAIVRYPIRWISSFFHRDETRERAKTLQKDAKYFYVPFFTPKQLTHSP